MLIDMPENASAVLALRATQHDPDLLFRRALFAGGTADFLDNLLAVALLGSGFLSHLHCLGPVKLCHYLSGIGEMRDGSKAVFG